MTGGGGRGWVSVVGGGDRGMGELRGSSFMFCRDFTLYNTRKLASATPRVLRVRFIFINVAYLPIASVKYLRVGYAKTFASA